MRRLLRLGDLARAIAVRAYEIGDPLTLRVLEGRRAVLAAKTFVGPVVADRPLDIDPVGGESLVQLVRHGAVEVSVIRARVGAELPEIEAGIARFEGVH